MKKIISMVLTVAMLLSMTAAYVSADDLVSHETDFETAESYSWADADSNTGSTATLAYGSNANNTAYMISANTSFGSLSYANGDNLKAYPVEGLSTTVIDIYPESTSFASHDQYSDYKFARLYTDSGDKYVWQFIKNNDTSLGIAPMGDFTKKVNVSFDKWTRLVLVYNPETGLGDFTVIKNVDTDPVATTHTGVTVTDANETKIDRFFLYSYRGETIYVDNVSFKETPASLALSSATPANGATDVAADSTVSFTFDSAVASAALKVNGADANFAVSGSTVTYTGTLETGTTYTVTGTVTGTNGAQVTVNHSFTTAAAVVEGPVEYTADFETAASYAWFNDLTGSTATLAYGSNAGNTAYMLSNNAKIGNYEFGTYYENPVTGEAVYSVDIYPESTSFASHDQYSDYKFAYMTTDSGSKSIWQFIKNNNTSLGIAPAGDFAKKVNVSFDTWTRLILVYNPTTGLGDFTVVKNVDTNPVETTQTGIKVTDANQTKIKRVYLYSYRQETIYIDNISLGQKPAALEQTAATPADNATNVALDSTVSFTFADDVESADLKVNGAAANFAISGSTVTYTGALEAGTTYTVTGTVVGTNGAQATVNHSFTTVRGPRTYAADFETPASYAWADQSNGSTVTAPYGTNANNTAYMVSNDSYLGTLSVEYGENLFKNPIEGPASFVFDFYPVKESFDLTQPWDYNFAELHTDNGGLGVWKLIGRGEKLGVVPMGRFLEGPEVKVDLETWTRLVLTYNPTTGLGDFTVIQNVDTANPTVTTFEGITVSAANQTKVTRMFLRSYRQNTVYVDNVSLRESAGTFALSDAHFVDEAGDKITDGVAVAKPTYKATATNNTDAPRKVSVVVVAMDGNKMVDFAMETVVVGANSTATVSASFDADDVSEYDIKGFIWNVDIVKPLTDVTLLEAAGN